MTDFRIELPDYGQAEEWTVLANGGIYITIVDKENKLLGGAEVSPDTGVALWSSKLKEGWKITHITEKMDNLFVEHGSDSLAVCDSCGHWSQGDEDGDCYLCNRMFGA